MDIGENIQYKSWRHYQDILDISRKPENCLFPYKAHIKRGVGEYYPTREDRVKLLKYLSNNDSIPYFDKKTLKEKMKLIDYYEYKGIGFGLLHGAVTFFLPGIRLLPLYKRLILPIIFFAYWKRWGYNLGRDFFFVKGRMLIENWERDTGARNFQTGY